MERFKIFPPIGIARLGGSKSFFIGSEKETSIGLEILGPGNETELSNYKDNNGLIKRQGARFHIFELDPVSNKYEPFDTTKGSVTWTVHLMNKKSAVVRPVNGNNIPIPPDHAIPVSLVPGATSLTLDGGEKSITGKNQHVDLNMGIYKSPINGSVNNVFLGELFTDAKGDLIVLGGHGISKSPSNQKIGMDQGEGKTTEHSFYYNKDWYDDTSDGFVKATITMSGDGTVHAAEGGWVIVAPPDYAPAVKGVVTLYDKIQDVTITNGSAPNPVSFTQHIQPIIKRFSELQWVNKSFRGITQSFATLSDNSAGNQQVRNSVRSQIKRIGSILQQFSLTDTQLSILQKWVDGSFVNDFGGVPPAVNEADSLTKNILDTTVGQGFFPGIEGGIILTNAQLYKAAFTLDHAKVTPGDITGLMALPWQADFLECENGWWPSQRPDDVLVNGSRLPWMRPIDSEFGHLQMVNNFNRLGFVKPSGTQMTEQERDPTF